MAELYVIFAQAKMFDNGYLTSYRASGFFLLEKYDILDFMDLQKEIAKALLRINAVGFSLEHPVTFTSGLRSPVYVDNRKFPFWPKEWRLVIEAFSQKIKDERIHFEVIAGIETAAIPHSSALAFFLKKPSVFVRKKAKEHGTKVKIEGGEVKRKKVLLIEDLVTTGGSSLAGVEALRQEGATVDNCIVIVSYGFPEAKEAFEKNQCRLHTLTSFELILKEARTLNRLTQKELTIVKDWLEEPHGWAKRHGFK